MNENILEIIQKLNPNFKIAFLCKNDADLNDKINYFKQIYNIYDFWNNPTEDCLKNDVIVLASDLKSKKISFCRQNLPKIVKELNDQINKWYLFCYGKKIVLFTIEVKLLNDSSYIRGGKCMYNKFVDIYSINNKKIEKI